MKRLQTIASLAAAGALLAVPTVGQANHGVSHGKSEGAPHGKAKGKGKGKTRSNCVVKKGFVVKGTLVSYTPDDANASGNQATVTITVTKGNRHARRSGEIAAPDSDPRSGVQYTVPTSDAFVPQLAGYEAGEVPGADDLVHLSGKVAVTKKKCADSDDTVAERYGAVDVRKVRFTEVG